MRYLSLLLIFSLISLNIYAGGGQEGGGGGVVHDSFIKAGKEVLYFLKSTREGKDIVKKRNLNLCRLKNTLNENLVYVYQDEKMVDHRGSIVDAYTYNWAIYIHEQKWLTYFDSNSDINHLVFKEMLRSEGTYFKDAINISLELKPFNLNMDTITLKDWNKFLKWFETSDSNCLEVEDKIQISKNLSSHKLTNKYHIPNCSKDIKISSGQQLADVLLDGIKTTKCKVEKSKCSISQTTEETKEHLILYKSVFWKGQIVYKLPLAVKDKKNNKTYIPFPFKSLLDDFIDLKINDLSFVGVCDNKPEADSKLPEFVDIKFNPLLAGVMDFEYLRKDNFLECPFCKRNDNRVLGVGSRVRILNQSVIKENSFGAKFVKVRVVESVLDKPVNNARKAKVGEEGWITITSTNYMYYLNNDFDVLTDR